MAILNLAFIRHSSHSYILFILQRIYDNYIIKMKKKYIKKTFLKVIREGKNKLMIYIREWRII